MKKLLLSIVCALFSAAIYSQTVNLGTAASYGLLAGSTITNTGLTIINGNVGLSPGTAVTGFVTTDAGPGVIIGTLNIANTAAAQAKTDLQTAFTILDGRTPTDTIGTELGGQTLMPGVYTSASGTFGITGTLTLDAGGDPNAVFVFQTATTLITAASSQIILINGAQACNVFFQVGSSATLGTNSLFQGTILAQTSITATTGADVNGRLLAIDAAVTLATNDVTNCVTAVVPCPALTLNAAASPCLPDLTTTVTATLSGAAPGATFVISGNGIVNVTGATTGIFTGVPNGTYTVTAAVGTCTYTSSVTVNCQATQTTCTTAPDPLLCATLAPSPGITFTPTNVNTTVLTAGTTVTATATALNPTQISITSNTFAYTGNDGCILVKFTQAGTANVSSTDVNILVNGQVITCTGVTLTAGTACLRICDPRITANSTISVRLDFNLAAGSLTGGTVIVGAFATAALPVQAVSCASNFICLTENTGCTTPCDPNFTTLSGKIRVFFTTPIPAGTPNPEITAVTNAALTLLGNYKLCAVAAADVNVPRSFVDYCVYTNAVSPNIATLGPLGIIFTGNTTPCIVPLLANDCPATIAVLNDPGDCTPCDPLFPNLSGKVRIFFTNPIPANVPNPIITSVAGLGLTAGTFKLCAATDAATDVARTFVDYCVFTNVPVGVTLPITISGPVAIGIQASDCSAPTSLCIVTPTVLTTCPILDFEVVTTTTAGTGGTGTAPETCAAQTTCNGATSYFASRLRVNFTPCIPAGVPAPVITGAQVVDANGNVTALGTNFCFIVSNESAADINTERCSIEYCVYSNVLGDSTFINIPAGFTLQFSLATTVMVNGVLTPLLQICEAEGTDSTGGQVGQPLPLNLLDFKASLVNGGVKLNWTTSEEVNVSHFEILRSEDGNNFSKINKVNAKGGAGKTNYELTDAVSINGKAFYRLNMVDLDGRSKLSPIVMIRLNGKNQPILVVAPNPVQSAMKVKMSDFATGVYNIELRNSIGQLQYAKTVQVNGSEHTETIDRTRSMSKGLYVLSIYNKTDNSRSSIRVIIE